MSFRSRVGNAPPRKLIGMCGSLLVALVLALITVPQQASAGAGLTQVSNFGTNPGNLAMFSYVPSGLPKTAPLVVALHGCTQSANDYYSNAGWPKYADMWKFAIVFPQTNSSNNSNSCFTWYDPAKAARGVGEALSIKQMVDYAIANYGLNPRQVYITGLSAGGAMTSDMLADYPDVFTGGSINAGIPAFCAHDLTSGSNCQYNDQHKTPGQWGDLVRSADSGYAGPWPRVAIWQGSSDSTVYPVNSTEERDQWTNVWGISQTASSTQTLTGGTTENIYNDPNGKPAVELYTISGMGHGTAVNPGSGIDQCGTTGTYYPNYICSTYYTAKFWGLDQAQTQGLPAPSGLAVTATTSSSAALSWNAVSGASSYDIYRNGSRVNTTAVSGTSYTDTGLSAGTSYSYTVAAVDSAGNIGSQSGPVTATTSGTAPRLPAPSGLAVTATTSSSAALSWNAVSGASSYDIYRNGSRVNTTAVSGTSYTDTGLSAGTSYSYTVAAVDSAGNIGSQSGPVTATTTAAPCFTDNNYNQTTAGRAYQSGGYVYADGSNQAMGLWNVYTVHTLKETGSGYYVIADGQC